MTSRTEEQIYFRLHLLDAVARRSTSERADELLSDAGAAIGWNDVIESSRSARHEWRIAGRVANCDMSVAARTADATASPVSMR